MQCSFSLSLTPHYTCTHIPLHDFLHVYVQIHIHMPLVSYVCSCPHMNLKSSLLTHKHMYCKASTPHSINTLPENSNR